MPSAPQGPIVTSDLTATSVVIAWKPPLKDGGLPITGYVIEKRDKRRPTWVKVEKVNPDILTYCVQNLTTGSDYYFRVFAENDEGLSPPLEMDQPVTPKRPPG